MKKMDLMSGNFKHQHVGASTSNSRELLTRLTQYIVSAPVLSKDLLVFKGGLFLGEHTGHPRYTQDVDMSIVSSDTYVRLKCVLTEFGNILQSEGVIASYEIQDDVVVGRSGGAKFRNANNMVLLSIDISLGGEALDTIVMDTSVAGTVRLESVEQVLADKLTVLYSRKRFRRSKDLYDVWQIITSCSPNIDALVSCLLKRDLYPLPLDLAPFREECYLQMEHAYNTLQVRDPVTEQNINKPTFLEVVEVVGKFTSKLMEAEV